MTRAVPIPHSERNKTIMEEKQTAPALTLEPDLSVPAVPTLTLDPEPAPPAQEERNRSGAGAHGRGPFAEEKKAVDEFAEKIDLRNSTVVLQYGAASQKKVADFSSSTLENIRTKDLGEVGEMVTGLVTELKSFDATEEAPKGIMGFFRKATIRWIPLRRSMPRWRPTWIRSRLCWRAIRYSF